jgi:hypothetical protein
LSTRLPQRQTHNEARAAALAAVLRIARELHLPLTSVQAVPGGITRARIADPLTGIQAARAAEAAAGDVTRDYIRWARETGHDWAEVGQALSPSAGTANATAAAAAAAFRFAVGEQAAEAQTIGYWPTFTWTCPACRAAIADRGPESGHPGDRETGHSDGCERLDAQVATWHAGRGQDQHSAS